MRHCNSTVSALGTFAFDSLVWTSWNQWIKNSTLPGVSSLLSLQHWCGLLNPQSTSSVWVRSTPLFVCVDPIHLYGLLVFCLTSAAQIHTEMNLIELNCDPESQTVNKCCYSFPTDYLCLLPTFTFHLARPLYNSLNFVAALCTVCSHFRTYTDIDAYREMVNMLQCVISEWIAVVKIVI